MYSNDLIFGKDKTEKVTVVEIDGNDLVLFKNDGSFEKRPFRPWILADKPYGKIKDKWTKLEGNQEFKYIRTFNNSENKKKVLFKMYAKKMKQFSMKYPGEEVMTFTGITQFKGLKKDQVSALSFDIETTGLSHDKDSKVLMISNTFRDIEGKITRKLFSIDDYPTDAHMIGDWCNWVQQINPCILLGHNIFGFDLPYLSYQFKKEWKNELNLGRENREIIYDKKSSEFRVDGTNTWTYYDIKCYGRHIIDTMFLAVKFDFGRKYDSFGLKQIIKQEGLEKEGRIIWDWETMPKPKDMWENMKNVDHVIQDEAKLNWDKFKEYCEDDADDSLKLYDLMIPQFFYYTQSMTKSFQQINNRATGSQLNSFLVRSYLQNGHSIPAGTEKKEKFSGAISYGNPGIYKNVYKVDVASLYPSILLTYKIECKEKDPNGHFLEMVKYFTEERLVNKAKGKTDRHFKDLEQGQKIVINSAYGLLGAPGLNFNAPKEAAETTRIGREILQTGIREFVTGRELIHVPKTNKSGGYERSSITGEIMYEWILGPLIKELEEPFQLVNVDTDSFSYSPGRSKLKEGIFEEHIEKINSLYKEGIVWEDDGYFKKLIVIKAKNYILQTEDKKVKIKGSALKATTKEKELKNFIDEVIDLFLKDRQDQIYLVYNKYAKKITDINDMTNWAKKVSVSKSVLNPQRTNEQNVLDAIGDKIVQEGDKLRVFVEKVEKIEGKSKTTLKLLENFDGIYCVDKYQEKLWKSLQIFSNVIDFSTIPNYKLNRNRELL